MLIFVTENPKSCGIVSLNKSGIVKDFFEKIENPPSNIANGAIYLFDYINKYRDSIGEGAFEWSETLYQDALDWNLELVRLKKYGHCTNIVNLGAEMINAYSTKTHELVNDDKMCKYIVDTWLASKHHYQGIISEKRIHDHETEISKKYKYLDVMPVSLMKYSAMSVVVKDMGHYYVYQVINRQL